MIVKNEERVLRRCLDCVKDLVDELIIVDTGSTDATKQIAAQYTDQLFDFRWIDDFSAARNFAFSKATQEYIYSADADEVIDAINQQRFLELKKTLSKEVEIVQMKYGNQLQYGTVYNYDEELRPKLFRRLREFCWEGSVHEMVRLEPVILECDVVITHMPLAPHGSRDLTIFKQQILSSVKLSKRLQNMYAKELYMVGELDDFACAAHYFEESVANSTRGEDEIKEAACIAAKAARLAGDELRFMKYACKAIALESCSEICMELGLFYEAKEDFEEAIIWYYNAAYQTTPSLSITAGTSLPLNGIARCYYILGKPDDAIEYEKLAREASQPRMEG
jgi:glycosyltransferase involved in cell wall biosynthesis